MIICLVFEYRYPWNAMKIENFDDKHMRVRSIHLMSCLCELIAHLGSLTRWTRH